MTADVILETLRPGFLASLGLDYESLCKQNPRLIMCALTPFGQTGPWRDYLSTDLLHLAAGGEMASSGEITRSLASHSIRCRRWSGPSWRAAKADAEAGEVTAFIGRRSV